MKTELLNIRAQYLKNNLISYDEFMNLSEDKCIKVNRTYFHYLYLKVQFLNKNDKNIEGIFSKYLEIDRMQNFINERRSIKGHYLMSIEEMKFLITSLNDIPLRIVFLKSDINKSQLGEIHDNLKKQFIEKKKESVLEQKTSELLTDSDRQKIKRKNIDMGRYGKCH